MSFLLRCSRAPNPFTRRSVAVVQLHNVRHYRDSKGRDFDPLRILYCGSDEFSVESLKKLTDIHRKDPSFIESIDVVCKPAARRSRGLKQVYESPTRIYAEQAGLPVHPISTFTGWQAPKPQGKDINLIIAVSFGLFVPPRLLTSARYGGLNVHPSLLPALRGPAPLNHTLIQGLSESGVSLCTLHPERFDHGTILRQQRFPLLPEITADIASLSAYMASRGSTLLGRGLLEGCFLEPSEEEIESSNEPSHAPKINVADTLIQWENWSCEQILRMQRGSDRLSMHSWWAVNDRADRKVRFHKLRSVGRLADPSAQHHPAGLPCIYWIQDKAFWVDRSKIPASETNHPRPDITGMLDVPDDICDGAIRVGKTQRPAVGGVWTKDGHFLTFEAMTIEFGSRKTLLGSIPSLQALDSLASHNRTIRSVFRSSPLVPKTTTEGPGHSEKSDDMQSITEASESSPA